MPIEVKSGDSSGVPLTVATQFASGQSGQRKEAERKKLEMDTAFGNQAKLMDKSFEQKVDLAEHASIMRGVEFEKRYSSKQKMELERIENDMNEIRKSKVLTDAEKQAAIAIKEKEKVGINPSDMPKEPTTADLFRKNMYEDKKGRMWARQEDGKFKLADAGLSLEKKADIITKFMAGGKSFDEAMRHIDRLEGNQQIPSTVSGAMMGPSERDFRTQQDGSYIGGPQGLPVSALSGEGTPNPEMPVPGQEMPSPKAMKRTAKEEQTVEAQYSAEGMQKLLLETNNVDLWPGIKIMIDKMKDKSISNEQRLAMFERLQRTRATLISAKSGLKKPAYEVF